MREVLCCWFYNGAGPGQGAALRAEICSWLTPASSCGPQSYNYKNVTHSLPADILTSTLAGNPAMFCQTSDLQTYELVNKCSFKLLNL